MLRLLREIFIYLYLGFISITFLFVSLVRPFHKNNMWLASLMCRIPLIDWLMGFEIEITGWEHIKECKASVVISNHQSNLDSYLMAKVFQPGTVVIGKKELKWIPIFGQMFWLAGNILLDRSNKHRAINSLTMVSDSIKNNGVTVWIMPEGTRSKAKSDVVAPFKKGAFHIALSTGAKIIPVAISPYLRDINLNKRRSGKISISVLPAVTTQNMKPSDLPMLLEHCHKLISNEVKNLGVR